MPIGWNDSAMTPGKVKGLHHLSYLCHKNPIGSVLSVHDVDFAALVCARNLMCKEICSCVRISSSTNVCVLVKCFLQFHRLPMTFLKNNVWQKLIEINAHFFPTLILLLIFCPSNMHAPRPRAGIEKTTFCSFQGEQMLHGRMQ